LALVTENKKGGPYTQIEQTNRQNQVYTLHFERGHSARKIAQALKVNRNTINSDITTLYSQMSDDWKDYDIKKWFMMQLERYDSQRSRLFDELDKTENLAEKLSIEKLIFEIDTRVTQLFAKLIQQNYNMISSSNLEIDTEKEIRKIVEHLIEKAKKESKPCIFTERQILFETIKLTKCNQREAEDYFDKMIDLGLEYFKEGDEKESKYDILEFSRLRGYTT